MIQISSNCFFKYKKETKILIFKPINDIMIFRSWHFNISVYKNNITFYYPVFNSFPYNYSI